MSPVSENDTNSISNYSRAINTIVWTFEDLGYDDDLKAASNVKTAVEKLPTSMILKWNEHLLHNKVSRPTLTVLAKCLQEQVEAHELLPTRGKPKYKPPGKWNGSQHGNGPVNNLNSQFNALSAHPDAGTPTPCALGDGNHPTSRCPQFIALNPDGRAEKMKKTKLCFCCLSPGHRARDCPTPKECNTGGCKKRHHPLMHNVKCVYQTSTGLRTACGLTSQQASQVLLQVLPVTIHGLAGLHRTYAMLDMGSTCTLIQASVADKVGLTGPTEQMILNGVQQRSCIA
ncbi:WDFY family member 4 [Paramuricea clavata]|uniref:WDFY family member 4 n=1 Tax=Paramuricea clavata TaxID=317549 RepID=A0A6S7FT71_PARCT|nr:WDFY family member 4 [Paramuricea clavata]